MNWFEKISFDQFKKDFASIYNEAIYNDIKLPVRATSGSAGYDFFAPYDFDIDPGRDLKVPTGIRIALDPNKVLLCTPKSGLGTKQGLQLMNTVGVVDSDYNRADNEGHIWAVLYNGGLHGKAIHIKKGQAFIQGLILPFYTTFDDEVSDKRSGGFGSTQK